MYATFTELTEALELELERLHYTPQTRTYYRQIWRKIRGLSRRKTGNPVYR